MIYCIAWVYITSSWFKHSFLFTIGIRIFLFYNLLANNTKLIHLYCVRTQCLCTETKDKNCSQICFIRYGCDVAIASRKFDRLQAAKKTLEEGTGQKCFIAQMDVRKVNWSVKTYITFWHFVRIYWLIFDAMCAWSYYFHLHPMNYTNFALKYIITFSTATRCCKVCARHLGRIWEDWHIGEQWVDIFFFSFIWNVFLM